MKSKNIIWFNLILVFLVSSCQLFSPNNVETIIKEDRIKYWHLSPNGNYLVYGAIRGKGNFLLNLATGEKNEFDCRLHWLDNKRFSCYEPSQLFVIDVETLTKIPLFEIDLTKEPSINDKPVVIKRLLAEADLIYRPEWVTDTVYLLALDYQLNPDKNYEVTGLTNSDRLLAKYKIITVNRNHPGDRHPEKTYSPNGLYYSDLILDGFAIYDANNNQIVSQYVEEHLWMLDILGWAPDSSGVYFVSERAGMTIVGPEAVRKLTIPDE